MRVQLNNQNILPTHHILLAKKTRQLQGSIDDNSNSSSKAEKAETANVSSSLLRVHAIRWSGSLSQRLLCLVQPMLQFLSLLFVLAPQHPLHHPHPASAYTCKVGTPRQSWACASTSQQCNLRGTRVHTAVFGLARAPQCPRDKLCTCYPCLNTKWGSALRWLTFL